MQASHLLVTTYPVIDFCSHALRIITWINKALTVISALTYPFSGIIFSVEELYKKSFGTYAYT